MTFEEQLEENRKAFEELMEVLYELGKQLDETQKSSEAVIESLKKLAE